MVISRKYDYKTVKPEDGFKAGDLVTASPQGGTYGLVYLLTGTGVKPSTMTGACVWSKGGVDRDGDQLPTVGYLHTSLGVKYLNHFKGHLILENE